MKPILKHLLQSTILGSVQIASLFLLEKFLPGFSYSSVLSGIGLIISFGFAQSIFWWVFIHFFAGLPAWIYPMGTFFLSSWVFIWIGRLVPGVYIDNVFTGIWISLILTAVSAILSGLLSLDEDAQFDLNITRKMVARYGKPKQTDVPGFLFLEIDGLSEAILQRALDGGFMPTLKSWIDAGTHRLTGWETEFSSQTGAMQTGILLGNNENISAYRWWSRAQKKVVISGNPLDARKIEGHLSNGRGLLAGGGASRGNMFSGDAEESMLTFSTLMNKSRRMGPGFYMFFFSPYVLSRLATRFIGEVIIEWTQAFQQRWRRDPYRISARNWMYAFMRGFMGPFLQDLITYMVISDMLRGIPAVYALYAGYDDIGHFAGMQSSEAFQVLHETDRYFARIKNALAFAPRPYHIVVLSDHGQSSGLTFEAAHGLTLEKLVQGLIHPTSKVFAKLNTNEAWDNLNAVFNESLHPDTRTAGVLRRMLASKTRDGLVNLKLLSDSTEDPEIQSKGKDIIVLGSGCAGMIYFAAASKRMTYEQIQDAYPDLILGLVSHPGVGFVLVKSEQNGALILGKKGIHYLDDGTVEGQDPLAAYGMNAAMHLKRESGFEDCPDLVVNTIYDPDTQQQCGFENQSGHHGGLGGTQNHPFILYPANFTLNETAIIGAESVYRLLRGWRDQFQP